MPELKVTTWNVKNLRQLLEDGLSDLKKRRRDAVVEEVRQLDPDVLCLIEGPSGEAAIQEVADDLLGGDYVPVLAADGDYSTLGSQWIWFLVKPALALLSSLLPPDTWDDFAGERWDVYYWGQRDSSKHRHYRHPQVLVLDIHGRRVEFVGLHLKSKYVNGGKSDWKAGGDRRQEFIESAIKARIKMTTETLNVRAYLEKKFEQVEDPLIFFMGDLNDGPGKDYFERLYLFLDLVSNLQGDVFFARRFLNHALFDFPDDLRWTVEFEDFVDPERDPHILLDHILFTQGLVNGQNPVRVNPNAGSVEHEIHDLVNASVPKSAATSDHRPVSVIVEYDGPAIL